MNPKCYKSVNKVLVSFGARFAALQTHFSQIGIAGAYMRRRGSTGDASSISSSGGMAFVKQSHSQS
jgi:hypothetical protein